MPFDIRWRALFKILAVAVLVWIWLSVWQLAMALVVSILIAVALEPVARWLESRGLPPAVSATLPVLVLTAVIVGFLSVAWSTLVDQVATAIPRLVAVQERVHHAHPLIERFWSEAQGDKIISTIEHYAVVALQSALRALVLVGLGLILTLYLLIERRKTLAWVTSFVPERRQARVRETLCEAREVVFGYVAGNVATSIFASVVVFAVLKTLDVPAALLLALLAGICDFVPVLGFLISAFPAVLIAMTVSNSTAVIVAAAYVSYHFVENYFIGPKVYGGRLQLSNVAVLVAFAVGAELGGVIGALLALPVAALYPTIERLWLRPYLASRAVEKHEHLAEVETH